MFHVKPRTTSPAQIEPSVTPPISPTHRPTGPRSTSGRGPKDITFLRRPPPIRDAEPGSSRQRNHQSHGRRDVPRETTNHQPTSQEPPDRPAGPRSTSDPGPKRHHLPQTTATDRRRAPRHLNGTTNHLADEMFHVKPRTIVTGADRTVGDLADQPDPPAESRSTSGRDPGAITTSHHTPMVRTARPGRPRDR